MSARRSDEQSHPVSLYQETGAVVNPSDGQVARCASRDGGHAGIIHDGCVGSVRPLMKNAGQWAYHYQEW